MKITNDQLKNYVGHGLKLNAWRITKHFSEEKAELVNVGADSVTIKFTKDRRIVTREHKSFAPVCYRMKDLATYIPELGFVPAVELSKLITQAGWQGEV